MAFFRVNVSFFFESKSHAREKDTLHRARARSGDRTISTVVMSGGVTRRAQERQTKGVGDVWDVIVKWDDICFQHIIPRLNSNDVKFLYQVNTETRVDKEIVSQEGVEEKVYSERDVIVIDFGSCVGE